MRLDGPARLTLSLRPALRVGGVRIANPPGFDSPDFARIGELHVAMELLPLLQDEIRVTEIRGRDVAVRLRPRGRWTRELDLRRWRAGRAVHA